MYAMLFNGGGFDERGGGALPERRYVPASSLRVGDHILIHNVVWEVSGGGTDAQGNFLLIFSVNPETKEVTGRQNLYYNPTTSVEIHQKFEERFPNRKNP
ncbi:hypothetical protein K2X83_02630 [Patescibacteria group bacterium]|nr:hypothetical protein [Patescibacteria group bacterium]